MRTTLMQVRQLKDVFASELRQKRSNLTAFLVGKPGTGKERLFKAVAAELGCAQVVIDCTTVPAELWESELFGYEEGAFSGALKGGKAGKVEVFKDKEGLLLIDEVHSIEKATQAKLLRFIQEKEACRLGSTEPPYKVHCQVVAATNRDLRTEVENEKFLPDLYHRLAGLEINLPSLSERREDIPLLIKQIQDEIHTHKEFSDEAWAVIFDYSWDGNVRELYQDINTCSARPKERVEFDDLPLKMTSKYSGRQEYLDHLMQASGWNQIGRARYTEMLDDTVMGPEAARTIYLQILRKRGQKDALDDLRELERSELEDKVKQTGSIEKAAIESKIPRATAYRRLKPKTAATT